MLSTMIIHIAGSCPENAIILDFSVDIYNPNTLAIFYNLNIPLCKLSSISATMK